MARRLWLIAQFPKGHPRLVPSGRNDGLERLEYGGTLAQGALVVTECGQRGRLDYDPTLYPSWAWVPE